MKLYFQNVIKSLLKEKKQSIFSASIIAGGAMLTTLFINLAVSFVGTGFSELESFFILNQIYTGETANAFYKLCRCFNLITMIVGISVIFAVVLANTLKSRKKFKNFMLMGASVSQIITISTIKNMILFAVGFVGGVIVSCLITYLIGIIYAVSVTISINMVLVAFIIGLAVTVMISVLIPLWTNTNIVQTNKNIHKIKE